jgi:hypothetical protein
MEIKFYLVSLSFAYSIPTTNPLQISANSYLIKSGKCCNHIHNNVRASKYVLLVNKRKIFHYFFNFNFSIFQLSFFRKHTYTNVFENKPFYNRLWLQLETMLNLIYVSIQLCIFSLYACVVSVVVVLVVVTKIISLRWNL